MGFGFVWLSTGAPPGFRHRGQIECGEKKFKVPLLDIDVDIKIINLEILS